MDKHDIEIQVDPKWRLVTIASWRWQVQQRRPLIKGPRKGQVDWVPEGEFDNLRFALLALYRMMLHSGKGRPDILQLAARVEYVEERLVAAVAQIEERVQPTNGRPKAPKLPASAWDVIEDEPG